MDIKDLQWLLNPGTDRRRAQAQIRRGGTNPEWVEHFFTACAIANNDPTINKETGMRHSVESMVAELRKRVQLDAIHKEAGSPLNEALNKLEARQQLNAVEKKALFSALQRPPLSYKKAERDPQELLDQMADYALRHHIKPSHGHTPPEALYEDLKDRFGIDGVQAVGGREKIIEMLRGLREEHQTPSMAEQMPVYDGSPIPLRNDYDPKDRALFMTRDTPSGGLGSYM